MCGVEQKSAWVDTALVRTKVTIIIWTMMKNEDADNNNDDDNENDDDDDYDDDDGKDVH